METGKKPTVAMAVFCMVMAMVSITAGASLAKTIFPAIGAEATTSLRLTFAAIVLFAVFRPWRFVPKKHEWRNLVFYGATLGTMNLIFYMSIARIPLGIALALEFTGPLALALYQSRTRQDIIWVICAVVGILLLTPLNEASADLDTTGIILALVAGIFWALYIVAGKRLGNMGHGGVTVAWGMMFCAITVSPVMFTVADFSTFTPHILLLGLCIGVMSSAIPYSLEIMALKTLPSKTFSILTSLEPAVGAVAGLVFLGEKLEFVHIIAIGFVVLASSGSTFFESRKKPLPELAN
ncbi:MAG: DMT family transporter [Alphaproteobacteria bacterium]|nr:DMT family transporter [Alphaproteobacteria bacterium]